MDIDPLHMIVSFITGLGLGGLYFGGLWLTVQRLPAARFPALLATGSFLFRMAVSLLGFYFVMDGQWQALLICVTGFFTIRVIFVRQVSHRKALPS